VDRQIVYPGGIPLDTDILNIERNIMVALGYLAQATLGTDIVADGLVCAPTLPASMSVTIGPGCVTQFSVVDPLAFGSLPAAPTVPLMKLGINVETTTFTLTAPTASGQAIDYLLEASFLESDATPVILPYYNAASPGMPYSGPGNSGAPQNTQRLQSVQFQMKAGAPGGAGTQLPPNVDAGWVGLYVITLTTGQTAVTAANITVLPDAPFIAWKLPQLTPGTSRCAVFTPANQGNWNVPAGVNTVKVRIWGGGGAGGAGFSGAGGGGAGGGYAEGYCSVTPGQTYFVTVGNGGAGAGTSGGNSSFGNLMSAAGGQAGNNGAAGSGGTGGAGGALGAGGNLALMGQAGGSAFLAGSVWVSGQGGGAYGGAGAEAVVGGSGTLTDGHAATLPGCGGAGGIGSGIGGQGGQGLVLLEY
jgi:hypothetical protein